MLFLDLGHFVGFSPSFEAFSHVSLEVSEELQQSFLFELSFSVLNEGVVDNCFDGVV